MRTKMVWRLSFFVFTAVALPGCEAPEIGHYEAPREVPLDTKPAPGESDQADRMLAVLVPHGEQAWFFKLAGAREEVDKVAQAFDGFIRSVRFTEAAGGEPEWTLPDGWEAAESESQMRFATLKIPGSDRPLEVSVSTLGWSPSKYVNMLLGNVNRWRGQLQLKSIHADELPDQIREEKLAAGDAIFVDLKGKLKEDAMKPPFAAAVEARKAAAEKKASGAARDREIAQADGKKSAEKSKAAEPRAAETPKLPFEFKMPDAWAPVANPQFAVAAFRTKDRDALVDISVTPMPPAGGDLLMNINRWRSMQLGLQPISEDELKTAAPAYKIDGREGHLVKLASPKDANPRQGITAALVKTGDTTWVFRMRGAAEAVEKQQENFEKFLNSIKFAAGEK